MINKLKEIALEICAATNLSQALDIGVKNICSVTYADKCMIYSSDHVNKKYILMACEGLIEEKMKSIPFYRKITDLINKRHDTSLIPNIHPRHDFFISDNTDSNKSSDYVGVPIIYRGHNYGYIVVQKKSHNNFAFQTEILLLDIATKLASVIANASITESINCMAKFANNDKPLRGCPNCHGIAIGAAHYISPPVDFDNITPKSSINNTQELTLFEKAISEVQKELKETTIQLSSSLPSNAIAIFDFYLTMSGDNTLYTDIKNTIIKGVTAETALKKVIQRHINKLNRTNEPYFKERASDLKDLGYRIFAYLQLNKPAFSLWYPKNSILIAEELTASMLGDIPHHKIIGLVSLKGSANSHIAILARALNIPSVIGIYDSALPVPNLSNNTIIVDGGSGLIYISPSEAIIKKYRQLDLQEKKHLAGIENIGQKPSITLDNHKTSLLLNADFTIKPKNPNENHVCGVGLFRTETLFLTRESLPSEYEQTKVYREQLKAFSPRMVTMRTLDAGGDKPVKHFNLKESNPSLGWRGIRITLDHPEVFMIQIRAMLKASFGLDNLQISLPMVSNMEELNAAIFLINRAYSEVKSEKTYFSIKKPALGLMIEVPASAYQVTELGKKVDFICVGSNDLTQYMLAVDRTNARVAYLYDTYHPAVLKTFIKIINDAHKLGKPVSICGEIAGDPLATIILIGMGFDALSMNASSLLGVKWVMHRISLALAQETLNTVLKLDNSADIKKSLSKTLYKLKTNTFNSAAVNKPNTSDGTSDMNRTNHSDHVNHMHRINHEPQKKRSGAIEYTF